MLSELESVAFCIFRRTSLLLAPTSFFIVFSRSFDHPPSTSISMLHCSKQYPGYCFLSSHRGGAYFSVFSFSFLRGYLTRDNSFPPPRLAPYCDPRTWTSRSQSVITDGVCSKSVDVTSGVPQGTVLGPLMFLLFISDMQNGLGCTLRLFADDALLYHKISHHDDTLALQSDLDKLGL